MLKFPLLLLLLMTSSIFVIKLASSDNDGFFEDWSSFNESQRLGKRGGLFLVITDDGLKSIEKLTFASLKRLGHAYQAASDNNKTIVIPGMEPVVAFRFIKGAGIGGKILLPRGIQISDDTQESDRTVQFLIGIEQGESGQHQITVPYCETKIGNFRDGFDSFVNENENQNDTCQIIRNWMGRFSKSLWSSCEAMTHLWLQLKENRLTNTSAESHTATSALHLDKLSKGLSQFSLDTRFADKPLVENQYLLLPFRGIFLYHNSTANVSLYPMIIEPETPKRMIQLVITEHFFNSFLFHMFEHDMLYVEETLSMRSLPVVVRYPIQSVCWSCQLKIKMSLSHVPSLTITTSEICITATFDLKMLATGFMYEGTIMAGSAYLDAVFDIYPLDDGIRANLSMRNFSVDPGTDGFASYMPATTKASLEHWFVNRVWPALNSVVQEAGHFHGITKFTNYHVRYKQGAVLVGADLAFDVEELVAVNRSLEETN